MWHICKAGNYNLSGRIHFPRAPHFICWREYPKQHDALFLYLPKGPDHCGGLPLWNPNPPLLHAHRLVEREPANLFITLYCSKPLRCARDSRSLCLRLTEHTRHQCRAAQGFFRRLCVWGSGAVQGYRPERKTCKMRKNNKPLNYNLHANLYLYYIFFLNFSQ